MLRNILVLACLLGAPSASLLAQGFASGDQQNLAPLINANIDIADATALIKALNDKSGRLAVPAAQALGNLQSTPIIVRELSLALQSKNELLVLCAAKSLLALGDRGWSKSASLRMDAVQNPVTRVQLAGVLAQTGDYSGWKHVTSILLDPKADRWDVADAFIQTDFFIGMKDEHGKEVNIPMALVALTPQMPESHLGQAQTEIQRLFTKLDRKRRGLPEPNTSKGSQY